LLLEAVRLELMTAPFLITNMQLPLSLFVQLFVIDCATLYKMFDYAALLLSSMLIVSLTGDCLPLKQT
jgi:hypothetical protein